MKTKFLALVEEVASAGIAEALCESSSAEELSTTWQNFWDEHLELFEKIHLWAIEFWNSNQDPIFNCKEAIENPMEVAIIIKIIESDDVTEAEICEDWRDLQSSLRNIGSPMATALAECMEDSFICDVTEEDIFSTEEDESDHNGIQ